MPFLDFVARHEGMTSVKIEVPPGYRARAMTLASKGGHITIALPAGDSKARTLTGNIRFDGCGSPFALRAVVKNGKIITGGQVACRRLLYRRNRSGKYRRTREHRRDSDD